MFFGELSLPTEYSWTAPAGVIEPTLVVPCSVNQRFPSGPRAMPSGALPAGRRNSVSPPVGVISPILAEPSSLNHMFPSGPATRP